MAVGQGADWANQSGVSFGPLTDTPRTVTAYIDAISAALDRQEKLIEEVKQTVGPVLNDPPQANKANDTQGIAPPSAITSPVVASLRSLLRRLEGQCSRLGFIRDAVEL